jgi:alpha-amylase/alpha-mannosidase (GH57 family)
VVNFTPVLLEQIDDYLNQINAWETHGKRIRDPLLAALAGPGLPVDLESRADLISACLRANEGHLINRFQVFRDLVDLATSAREPSEHLGYLNDQFVIDLLVWYHLAWMGESVRENDQRVVSLQLKERNFGNDDRFRLVMVIRDQLRTITRRYKRLARGGQVELSFTPHAHPILPLLLDMNSAKEAFPAIDMPKLQAYPGGEARARWHIRRGIEVFRRHFGFAPKGCWPAEGAVSDDTLRLLEEEGMSWAASGQQVLSNSLDAARLPAGRPSHWPHRPYRFGQGKIVCFFRDEGLSDLIGFTYADWHAEDAVSNLLQNLENIAAGVDRDSDAVAAIIMDGENAWEYYPRNGAFFLGTLYRRLAEHPKLNLTTFQDYLRKRQPDTLRLPGIVAGSWVYGTLSTWIGDKDKNRAWDMLGDAKRRFDEVVASGSLTEQQIEKAEIQLATCEGSDWFWWFGDYNPGETVSDFEQLYRRQLTHLYTLLGVQPPEYLAEVFARGSGDPSRGGVMRTAR